MLSFDFPPPANPKCQIPQSSCGGSYSENSFTKKQLVRFLCLLWFLDLWTAWFSIMGIKFKKKSQENVSLSLQILAIKLLPTTTLSRNLSCDHWSETNLFVSQYTELYFLKCLDHTVNTYPQVRFVSLSPKPNVLCNLQYSIHTHPRRYLSHEVRRQISW